MKDFAVRSSVFNGKYWSTKKTTVVKASSVEAAAGRAARVALKGVRRREGIYLWIRALKEVDVETD